MSKLKGKRVLITGGASGIGFCTAKEFAKADCQVIITDINKEALDEAGAKLRQTCAMFRTYVIDVKKQKKVEELAEQLIKELGGIDILINNAGIGHSGELVETSLTTWKRLLEVKKGKPVEMVHLFNNLAYYSRFIPKFSELLSIATITAMGKSTDELKNDLNINA